MAVEQNKVLMPPSYNKYAAWGFADHSLRIGNYDNDKAVFVCETVAQACGEIVCCVCPSSKVLVTSGTSTVRINFNFILNVLFSPKTIYFILFFFNRYSLCGSMMQIVNFCQ